MQSQDPDAGQFPFRTVPSPPRQPITGWAMTILAWGVVCSLLAILILGLLIVLGGATLIETGMVDRSLLSAYMNDTVIGSYVVVVLVCLGLSPAVPALLKNGRKRLAISASELLTRDRRAQVLLLRSFDDDDLVDPTPSRLFLLGPQRYEARLARTLARIGPPVAIGTPGEAMPELGAARVYVHDEDWQYAVHHFLATAAATVVVVGRTDGVWWEVVEASKITPPHRLLFVFPNVESKRARRSRWRRAYLWLRGTASTWGQLKEMEIEREQRYLLFRERTRALFQFPLPESLGTAQFLTFSSSGEPRILESRRRRWLVMLSALGDRTTRTHLNVKMTLKPFIERLQNNS